MSTPMPAPPGAPGAPPAKKSLLWLWILLGGVGCVGVGLVALVAGGAFLYLGKTSTAFSEAKAMTAQQQIESFRAALAQYQLDCGRYPTGAQGLDALVHDPGSCPGWKPYLDGGEVPQDPWGNAYRYSSPGTQGHEVEIVSAGPDGKLGTSDDVTSW